MFNPIIKNLPTLFYLMQAGTYVVAYLIAWRESNWPIARCHIATAILYGLIAVCHVAGLN